MIHHEQVPKRLCQARLIFIPKPGKEHSKMAGNRPISIGSILAKILCSVWAARLTRALFPCIQHRANKRLRRIWREDEADLEEAEKLIYENRMGKHTWWKRHTSVKNEDTRDQ